MLPLAHVFIPRFFLILMSAPTDAPDRLLSEFAPHTYDAWKDAAVKLLKGKPFDKLLVTPTYEGFAFDPVYLKADAAELPHLQGAIPGTTTQVRGPHASGYRTGGWGISQEMSLPTPEELNQVALHELENGQNELNLWPDFATRAGKDADDPQVKNVGVCGTSLNTVADFEAAFKGIHLDYISLYLRAGLAGVPLTALLAAYAEEAGLDLAMVRGCMELDPLAYALENGHLPGGLEAAYDEMAAVTKWALEVAPMLQTIGVQTHAVHNGGGASHQEMAVALANGVAYLRAMIARGLSADEVAPKMRVSLSIGPNYFIEVAKFRAFRMVWARMLEAFGVPVEGRGVHLHARTGLWNKTTVDIHTNMLRGTTEAFSAVVGGVDSLTVGAFDELVREADGFSRRIARNIHHILGEECDLQQVVDPAGGSWAVEVLTDKMADQAWKLFQEIEAAGGIIPALETQMVQGHVAKTLAAKKKKIEQRRDTIVGINNYPNLIEKPDEPANLDYPGIRAARVDQLTNFRAKADREAKKLALRGWEDVSGRELVEAAIAAVKAGATVGEVYQALPKGDDFAVEKIGLLRGSGDYEALMAQTKALGEAATLLQVNFGPSRKYRARADWTSAFFRVGGFPVEDATDFESVEAAAEAAKISPAKVAIICSDDATYAESAAAVAQALKAARPELFVVLAGAPGDHESAWRAAGVDDFVHVRVNNYQFLKGLLEKVSA